jgi:hypothetical protein
LGSGVYFFGRKGGGYPLNLDPARPMGRTLVSIVLRFIYKLSYTCSGLFYPCEFASFVTVKHMRRRVGLSINLCSQIIQRSMVRAIQAGMPGAREFDIIYLADPRHQLRLSTLLNRGHMHMYVHSQRCIIDRQHKINKNRIVR